MWPRVVDWQALRFGVEIEFVEGDPKVVELLPGWEMALDERQIDESGCESGSELKPPPIRWCDREQIREMLARLRATGARANWSCGLHVHVGLEPWGEEIILPLLDAALAHQASLQALLHTAEDRLIYCPPIVPEMRERFLAHPDRSALVHRGRPQSHRCGINVASWFDFGTVEIRYANATLTYEEVASFVELCLRFVAAVGAGRPLPRGAAELAAALGAPVDGYPSPQPAPLWYRERVWMEEALVPVPEPLVKACMIDGEILSIRPIPGGFRVIGEEPDCTNKTFLALPGPNG